MDFPPTLSRKANLLALAASLILAAGMAMLLSSIFWATSVLLPLGLGGLAGSWLLFELAMEQIMKDNSAGNKHAPR